MRLADVARLLHGRRSGTGWLMRCPAHDDRNPSLLITEQGGRHVIKCFAGCERRDILLKLRQLGLGEGRREQPKQIAKLPCSLEWSAKATQIWAAALPLPSTPGETYLRSRGCHIPICNDLRFLAARGKHPPALLARITDAITNAALSLHFTSLKADGSGKAITGRPKTLLRGHRKAGGVIRLTNDEDVTYGLGIAEGIETALSVMAAGWGPVWATVDAGNMGSFPVLEGIESLSIFADHDDPGKKAAAQCATRWNSANRMAKIILPGVADADWADVGIAR